MGGGPPQALVNIVAAINVIKFADGDPADTRDCARSDDVSARHDPGSPRRGPCVSSMAMLVARKASIALAAPATCTASARVCAAGRRGKVLATGVGTFAAKPCSRKGVVDAICSNHTLSMRVVSPDVVQHSDRTHGLPLKKPALLVTDSRNTKKKGFHRPMTCCPSGPGRSGSNRIASWLT